MKKKGEGLNFFEPFKGALKKNTTNCLVKIEFTCFSMGLTRMFYGKKGSPDFFSKRVGAWKLGSGIFFPPAKVAKFLFLFFIYLFSLLLRWMKFVCLFVLVSLVGEVVFCFFFFFFINYHFATGFRTPQVSDFFFLLLFLVSTAGDFFSSKNFHAPLDI